MDKCDWLGWLLVLLLSVGWVLFGRNPDIQAYGTFHHNVTHPLRVDGNTLHHGDGFVRRDLYFPCSAVYQPADSRRGERSLRCHAWYFRPEGTEGQLLPLVIMGSGLGAQIDFGMDTYAVKLVASARVACLLFEYRGFGSSEGHPRNLVDPAKHLADWRSALRFASDHHAPQTRYPIADEVNLQRVGLWGSSLAGGHVLVVASELQDKQSGLAQSLKGSGLKVVCLVSQSPHLDGRENRRKNLLPVEQGGRGLWGAVRVTRCALQDLARSYVPKWFQRRVLGYSLGAAYVSIVGPAEGKGVALMPLSPSELELYFRKHPSQADQPGNSEGHRGGGWRNMAPARVALKVGFYSPIDFVPKLRVPVLFVAAEKDSLCPPELVAKAHALCNQAQARFTAAAGTATTKARKKPQQQQQPKRCELNLVEGVGHFGLYYDEAFQSATSSMASFLSTHLFAPLSSSATVKLQSNGKGGERDEDGGKEEEEEEPEDEEALALALAVKAHEAYELHDEAQADDKHPLHAHHKHFKHHKHGLWWHTHFHRGHPLHDHRRHHSSGKPFSERDDIEEEEEEEEEPAAVGVRKVA